MSSPLKRACIKEEIPQSKLYCIPNGVNTSIFRPIKNAQEKLVLRKNLNLPQEHTIVTFVGRICLRKGSDILLDAWQEVINHHNNVLLLMIGPYDKRENVTGEERIFNLKIEQMINTSRNSMIFFVGQQTSVEDYLRASDIFVFPSRFEGFGTAIIEAMACGLPVISSSLRGISYDIIDNHQDGIIIQDDDHMKLFFWIDKLIRDRNMRNKLKENATKKANDKFSINIVAREYKKLYQRLLYM